MLPDLTRHTGQQQISFFFCSLQLSRLLVSIYLITEGLTFYLPTP
jgi:hypothetical protein